MWERNWSLELCYTSLYLEISIETVCETIHLIWRRLKVYMYLFVRDSGSGDFSWSKFKLGIFQLGCTNFECLRNNKAYNTKY